MKKIYTPDDIQRITAATIGNLDEIEQMTPGMRDWHMERRSAFIQNVGRLAAHEVMQFRGDSDAKVLVFAGDGLCGAYALDTATELHRAGCPATVVLFNIGGDMLTADTRAARDRFVESAGAAYLTEVINPGPDCFTMPYLNARNTIVVDGIFGSEYRKPLRGGYQAVARHINESGVRVVALDLPSGMTTDLSVGMVNCNIVHATLTLALIGPTLAFFMPENVELVGQWKVLPAQFDPEALRTTRCTSRMLDAAGVRAVLPKRAATVSKADLGDVLVYAGSYGMCGAAMLATKAATRSGCGRVTCHGPRCAYMVLQTSVPSAMFVSDGADTMIYDFDNGIHADAVAIGPGIGRGEETAIGLEVYLKAARAAQRPVVLDADALNIIASHPRMLDYIPARSIITPHAGEFDRLFGPSNTHGTRTLAAIEMAHRYGIVIVLKGYKTITVWPDGSLLVNTSGTEALATAGSGDVLTGITAGILAQKLAPELAAAVAVYIHGVAGRIAARTYGIFGTTADDIAEAVGPAIQTILYPKAQQ